MSIESGAHSPESMAAANELESFEATWTTPDSELLMGRVMKKINKLDDPEKKLSEIRRLDNQLSNAIDGEDILEVLKKYLGEVEEDEDLEDEDPDGYGSDEEDQI